MQTPPATAPPAFGAVREAGTAPTEGAAHDIVLPYCPCDGCLRPGLLPRHPAHYPDKLCYVDMALCGHTELDKDSFHVAAYVYEGLRMKRVESGPARDAVRSRGYDHPAAAPYIANLARFYHWTLQNAKLQEGEALRLMKQGDPKFVNYFHARSYQNLQRILERRPWGEPLL